MMDRGHLGTPELLRARFPDDAVVHGDLVVGGPFADQRSRRQDRKALGGRLADSSGARGPLHSSVDTQHRPALQRAEAASVKI